MPDQFPEPETKSRQEQILKLASEGLTDKEIAARLKLSPETVGTYWRRILAKYSAASRTEVVAKVIWLQAENHVEHLVQVSEGLREVTDHLLGVLNDSLETSEQKLEDYVVYIPDLIVCLDAEGFIEAHNGAQIGLVTEPGAPFEWLIARDDQDRFRTAMHEVSETSVPVRSDLNFVSDGASTVRFAVSIGKSPTGTVLVVRPVSTP